MSGNIGKPRRNKPVRSLLPPPVPGWSSPRTICRVQTCGIRSSFLADFQGNPPRILLSIWPAGSASGSFGVQAACSRGYGWPRG